MFCRCQPPLHLTPHVSSLSVLKTNASCGWMRSVPTHPAGGSRYGWDSVPLGHLAPMAIGARVPHAPPENFPEEVRHTLSVCLSLCLTRCYPHFPHSNRSTPMRVCLELHALCKRICMGYTRIRVCMSECACVSIYVISVCDAQSMTAPVSG